MRVWDGRVRAPAPTKFGGIFRFCCRGQRPRRPAGGHMGPPLRRKTGRERWLGKLRRGSGTAPRANFAHPGPSGPAGIEILTQILRAGRALMRDRRAPVKGARGKAVIGEQSSPLRRPQAAFCPIPRYSRRSPAKRVRREEEEQGNERSFRRQAETEWSGLCDDEPPRAKSLAARRRRNSPCEKNHPAAR